jgi:hypothetical protein
MSRLIAGNLSAAVKTGTRDLNRKHRDEQGKSIEEMSRLLGINQAEYTSIEAGESAIEKCGRHFLIFLKPSANRYLASFIPVEFLSRISTITRKESPALHAHPKLTVSNACIFH